MTGSSSDPTSDSAAEPSASGRSYSIRAATPEDFEEVEAFIQDFVDEGRILPRTTEELRNLLPQGFVAEIEGKIVGFAALEIYSPKLGEIRSLAVDDDLRGRGIGRALVRACIGRAEERRIFEVLVVTSEDAFFQRCGFDYTLPGEKRALFYQTREHH
ncbi:MAG: GNAT family N-acetyltransferase [Longimicrobiales bacterium]|nr:GNAT family N-acetyltransferase [Longimicrobiales bacterium]